MFHFTDIYEYLNSFDVHDFSSVLKFIALSPNETDRREAREICHILNRRQNFVLFFYGEPHLTNLNDLKNALESFNRFK